MLSFLSVFLITLAAIIVFCCLCCCCCTSGHVAIIGAAATGAAIGINVANKHRARRHDEMLTERSQLVQPQQPDHGQHIVQAYSVQQSAPPSEFKYDDDGSLKEGFLAAEAEPPPLLPEGPPTVTMQDPEAAAHQMKQAVWRDGWAGALFLLNVAVITALAIHQGVGGSVHLDPGVVYRNPEYDDDHSPRAMMQWLLACLGVLTATSAAASLLWVGVLICCARGVLYCVVYTMVALLAGAAVVLGLAEQTSLLLVALFLAAFSVVWWGCTAKGRIEFAAANLSVACRAVAEHSPVLLVAVLMVALQLLWCVVWAVAAAGVYLSRNEEGRDFEWKGRDGLIWAGMLLSFYWGLQVVCNIVRVTVAGAVGSWWFVPQQSQAAVVGGALTRACSTSFGSVCLGSLLVSLVEAVRSFLLALGGDYGRGNCCNSGCCRPCASRLLDLLDRLLHAFNRWAFSYVGIYGYNFREAGKRVVSLFRDRGLTMVINETLIANCLALGSVAVGCATCAVGILVADTWEGDWEGDADPSTLLGVSGFLLGFACSAVVMRVIESAASTVMVCFAEDASALQRQHPREFMDLDVAWREMFPGRLEAGWDDHPHSVHL